MRPSLQDMPHMIVEGKRYPGLPEELQPFYVYLRDSGHSIMGIPHAVIGLYPHETDRNELECAIPVKYVTSHTYDIRDGFLHIDAPYDRIFGLDVDESYTEY